MRLQDIMSVKVETALPQEPAVDAWQRMRRTRIHHLVVVQGGRLLGVVSDRDLGGARGGVLREGKTVGELMTPHVVSARPETTVRQAANLLRGRSVGCLPVIEGGKLRGVITVSDLLELLGRGWERPAARTRRWTLKHRGPRLKPYLARPASR